MANFGILLKDLFHKKIRYNDVYKPSDEEIKAAFLQVIGSEESKVQDGTATELILVWNNNTKKYVPATVADFKNLLNYDKEIVNPGDAFNKFLVWNDTSKKYEPLSVSLFASEIYPAFFFNIIFSGTNIGQSTPIAPCIPGAGIPVNIPMKLLALTSNTGKPAEFYSRTFTNENDFYPGQELMVICDNAQDGLYCAIDRILPNGNPEHIFSGKITESVSDKVVINLKFQQIRSEQ